MLSLVKSLANVLFLAALSLNTYAHSSVVVIPMGGDSATLQNVITVSQSGGDFSDPVEAMKSISDADENNRYLIVIGPGIYTLVEALVMKEYVNISGSGQNVTKLTGAISTGLPSDSAVVVGSHNSSLTDISIENTGGDSRSYALYNFNASPRLERVELIALDGTFQTGGIYNQSSSPTMSDLVIEVSTKGAAYASGVSNSSSSPIMDSVKITVSSEDSAAGVSNTSSSSPRMTNITIAVTGGSTTYGVTNFSSSSPHITHATITAEGGASANYGIFSNGASGTMQNITAMASGVTFSYGVQLLHVSTPYIQDSFLEGGTAGLSIHFNSDDARIVNSRIVGGVEDNDAGTQCRGNFDQATLADIGC